MVIEKVPLEDTAAAEGAENLVNAEQAVGSEESGGKKEKSRRNRKSAAEDKQAEIVVTEQNVVVPAEEADTSGEGAEEPAADSAAEEFDKPEVNAVKRDILQFVASAENGGSLSRLGGMLAAKYGRDFLKQLGFTSMRRLAAEITGTVVKNNKLYISDEFARQTEEIEKFVNEFAHGEGSRSIRALGIQLKERFEGFDYRSYGFTRFTDFINAIDGVKAERYHVRPED